jgi:carbamoyltransferase
MVSSRISMVIVATQNATYSEGIGHTARRPLLARVTDAFPKPEPVGRRIRDSFAAARRRRVDEALRSEFGIKCPIRFVDHHVAHAVGAAYGAGAPDSLAITLDGGADGCWGRVTRFRQGIPEERASLTGEMTLLGFLETVCDALGIAEGLDRLLRLEILAGEGEPTLTDALADHLRFDGGGILVGAGGIRELTSGRVTREERRADLAASALEAVARATHEFVDHWAERESADTVVLGGDLFESSRVVEAVLESSHVRRVAMPLAPGDVSLSIGAAFAGGLPGYLPRPLAAPTASLATPFLGLAFSDQTIERALRREEFDYRVQSQIESDLARVLAEGKTIARFHGKTEIGNGGLGNRTILRSPEGALRRGRVGFLVPAGAYHAIVTPTEYDDWFEPIPVSTEDLSNTPWHVRAKAAFRVRCPELVGNRGTVRVQIVSAESNPGLFRILKEFESWSGIAVLAAAPFRLPDEPLVSSPMDALRTFRLLGADYAALGNFLVRAHGRSRVFV